VAGYDVLFSSIGSATSFSPKDSITFRTVSNSGFAVSLTGAGSKTTGIIRCDQPRALDLAARDAKKLESIPDVIMAEVLARLAPIFE